MTNTTIFAIATLTVLLLVPVVAQNVFGAENPLSSSTLLDNPTVDVKAIPDWVRNNFEWYLNNQIDEKTLLTSMNWLFDQNLMHLSDKAAQEVSDLRAENTALKKKLDVDDKIELGINIIEKASDSPVDEYGRVKVQFHWDEETEQEAFHHLRKAYDLDPALQTKVVQFDNNHDKWIDVLSIDWGSSSSQEDCSATEGGSDENSSCWIRVSQVHAGEEIWTDEYGATSSSGDPDRPLITGRVYNSETTDDRPTEEVAFYYNKIASASETVHDLVNNGETSTTGWDEGVAAFTSKNYGTTSASDGVHEVAHALGMMNNAIEKEIQTIEGEVAILGDLMDMFTSTSTSSAARATTQYSESDFQFISRYTSQIDTKIQSLQTGLRVLDDMLSSVGDDAQLVNNDLLNAIEKNQDMLDTLKAKTTQINSDGEFWFEDLVSGY